MTKKMTLEELSQRIGKALLDKNFTLSVAESCTGGLLGSVITETPGSSAYFRGGIISYDNGIKEKLLCVPHQVLLEFGAVSSQTVEAMAKGAATLLETDCAISVSGIAGPDGGTQSKPVGLVFIGIAVKEDIQTYRFIFKGTRSEVREQATRTAFSLLLQQLDSRQ
ncbi:MAG: CinA family protein [Fibrobacter sp.]|nr:CinA family protein [Fibrobacter sp.]